MANSFNNSDHDSAHRLTPLSGAGHLQPVSGFRYAGVSADIRGTGNPRLDLGLVVSDRPAATVAMFTTHEVPAAPVSLSRQHLTRQNSPRALFVNSGNANACTGEEGYQDASCLCRKTAELLQLSEEEVLICSTGRIGRRLPMDRMLQALPKAVKGLSASPEAGAAVAQSILTSDTRPKTSAFTLSVGSGKGVIAGMAKGAGMIQPDMATMLAFILTDFSLPAPLLQKGLQKAVQGTFNRISIDGDMSTNDTVMLMANGASGISLEEDSQDWQNFQYALQRVCGQLAYAIVADGERIAKVIELNVLNARSEEDAEKVARAVGNSLLVKTSWFGSDPNWGRLVDAAGYAGAGLDYTRLDILYDNVPAILKAIEQPANLPDWKKVVEQKSFSITLNLNQGRGCFTLLTTDLTTGYVDFNKSE